MLQLWDAAAFRRGQNMMPCDAKKGSASSPVFFSPNNGDGTRMCQILKSISVQTDCQA
jgi:hypothetical protein